MEVTTRQSLSVIKAHITLLSAACACNLQRWIVTEMPPSLCSFWCARYKIYVNASKQYLHTTLWIHSSNWSKSRLSWVIWYKLKYIFDNIFAILLIWLSMNYLLVWSLLKSNFSQKIILDTWKTCDEKLHSVLTLWRWRHICYAGRSLLNNFINC